MKREASPVVAGSVAIRREKTGSRRRLLLYGFLLALGIGTWAEFVGSEIVGAWQRPHWTNPAYWVAGRLAVEGRGALIFVDRATFARESIRLGTLPDVFDANAPVTVLPFLPFGLLSEQAADHRWLILILVATWLACGILLATLRLPLAGLLALWALIPLYHPLRENFHWGQVYPLILLFLVVAAVLTLVRPPRTRPAPLARAGAGVAFGLIAIFKFYYGALLLIPALVRRRWTLLAASAAVFGAAALITVAWWGVAPWIDTARVSLTWRERPETGVTAYQTVNSLLSHLFRAEPDYNPQPLLDSPGLVVFLWWICAALLAGISLAALWRAGRFPGGSRARQMLPLALMVPLGHLLAPLAEDYHYALMLFPLLVACAALAEAGGPPQGRWWPRRRATARHLGGWLVLGAAALLLGVDWPFNVLRVDGWETFLHYPRVYGAFLVWLLMLILLWRPPATQPALRR